jgi:cell division protein FtsB
LKVELNTADERYQHIVQENAMIGEDYRSRAAHNYDITSEQKALIKKQKKEIKVLEAENLKQLGKIERFKEKAEGYIMEKEDVCGYFINLQDRTSHIDKHLKNVIDEREYLKDRITALEKKASDLQDPGRFKEQQTMTKIGASFFERGARGAGNVDSNRSNASGSLPGRGM